MSLFNPIPDDVLRANFTHYGLAFGIVPVYVAYPDDLNPGIAVRNGIPDCVLDFFEALWITVAAIASLFVRDFDPESKLLLLTGEIHP